MSCNDRNNKRRAIRELRHSIEELREAIRFLRRNKFERAEDEISDALRFEAKALRRINRAERDT
jgi:ribosomal protein L22